LVWSGFRSRRRSKAKEGEEGAEFDGEVVIDDVVEDQQLDAAADEEPQE
jgi:DNA gyrase subunit A